MLETASVELRRQHLRDVFKMQAKERLTQSLPALERTLFDNPHISYIAFEREVDRVVRVYSLNQEQKKIIFENFERYQQDKQAVAEYRDLVITDPDQRSDDPFHDIASDRQAFHQLIVDVTEVQIGDKKYWNSFELISSVPSCLILKYSGPMSLFRKAQNLPAGYKAVAVFVPELELCDEKKSLDHDALKRCNLLTGKLIFLLPIKKEDYIAKDEEDDIAHELRHYLFHLYWREAETSSVNEFLSRVVLDEVAAYYGSNDRRRLNFDHLLTDEVPKKFGRVRSISMHMPFFSQELPSCIFQIERLREGGYTDIKIISDIATTCENLTEFSDRLSKIVVPTNPDLSSVYYLILDFTLARERSSRNRFETFQWIHAVISFIKKNGHEKEEDTIKGLDLWFEDNLSNICLRGLHSRSPKLTFEESRVKNQLVMLVDEWGQNSEVLSELAQDIMKKIDDGVLKRQRTLQKK